MLGDGEQGLTVDSDFSFGSNSDRNEESVTGIVRFTASVEESLVYSFEQLGSAFKRFKR